MADIFISYSSKDREKAEQLTELLASAGLSVWIDKQGIGAATSWSGEITRAISDCKALVVMLSPSSVESKNVVREVSLAFEKNKKILPLDLEPVALTDDLAYHLAGLQRTPMTNIDAIIRAIGKLGLEATQAPTMKLVKETDSRKSLMILPFEDLSPTADNEWFADGLASEMISKLSVIKSLRLIDWNTSKLFKQKKSKTTDVAREFSVRYFIEGQVRKFGDQLKISVTLLDIETGDHLWQDSFRGQMKDIFDIQDEVAGKVVEGMKLHVSGDEHKKLLTRGTENDEAYTLAMKARDYNNMSTRESLLSGAKLASDAIELDKNYAYAYYVRAFALAESYRHYNRDPALLEEAESLSNRSLEIKPDFYLPYVNLISIYTFRGSLEKAEAVAKEYVRLVPDDPRSYFALAFFYTRTNRHKEAFANYERTLELMPENLVAYFNLCVTATQIPDCEVLAKWAQRALPYFEKHLRFSPDDHLMSQWYSSLLGWGGNHEKAKQVIDLLLQKKDLDPKLLYNIASYLIDVEPLAAFTPLRRSLEAGFADIDGIIGWRDFESIRSNPDYARELEDIIQLATDLHTKTSG